MAFVMPFTDHYGEEYPESYWRLEQWNLSKGAQGRTLFYGYPSEAQKGKRIIGQKDYALTEAQFNEYFASSALNPEDKNPQEAAYRMAKATQDTGEGEELVSFFAGAEDA